MWRATSRQDPAKDPAAMARELKRELGTKGAAERLGVTPRTVQRWTTTTGTQRRAIKGPAAAKVRQSYAKSPEVRKASTSRLRAARIRNKGATVRVKGQIGPVIGGKDYRRPREITTQLSGEAMDRVLDAWMRGDDKGARAALERGLDEEYQGGFRLDDEIDLDFLR
jgi:hypothetical protein